MKKVKLPKWLYTIFSVIARFFSNVALYFKVVILGITQIDGYTFKEVGNSPIVGNNYFKGYEIINPKTNKVLYRRVKDWGYIGDGFRSYNPSRYNVVSKFFAVNAL